jgi:hypothetical protein
MHVRDLPAWDELRRLDVIVDPLILRFGELFLSGGSGSLPKIRGLHSMLISVLS